MSTSRIFHFLSAAARSTAAAALGAACVSLTPPMAFAQNTGDNLAVPTPSGESTAVVGTASAPVISTTRVSRGASVIVESSRVLCLDPNGSVRIDCASPRTTVLCGSPTRQCDGSRQVCAGVSTSVDSGRCSAVVLPNDGSVCVTSSPTGTCAISAHYRADPCLPCGCNAINRVRNNAVVSDSIGSSASCGSRINECSNGYTLGMQGASIIGSSCAAIH